MSRSDCVSSEGRLYTDRRGLQIFAIVNVREVAAVARIAVLNDDALLQIEHLWSLAKLFLELAEDLHQILVHDVELRARHADSADLQLRVVQILDVLQFVQILHNRSISTVQRRSPPVVRTSLAVSVRSASLSPGSAASLPLCAVSRTY